MYADMWPILLSAMILINRRRHFAILSENKCSLPIRFLVERPEDLLKDGFVDDLE